MSLAQETLITALGIFGVSTVPLLLPAFHRASRVFFLMGTGAMFGICFFDLIPDIYELGGGMSLSIMVLVSISYSILHSFYIKRHSHGPATLQSAEAAAEGHGLKLFLASIYAHTFSTGMLLVVSRDLSEAVASTVFVALLVHKAYEALIFASILIQQRSSLRRKLAIVAGYALSLPLGVLFTVLFHEKITHGTALAISSVAVGTLLACLIFDFLLPSLRGFQRKKRELAWLVGGLLLTQVIMTYFS